MQWYALRLLSHLGSMHQTSITLTVHSTGRAVLKGRDGRIIELRTPRPTPMV